MDCDWNMLTLNARNAVKDSLLPHRFSPPGVTFSASYDFRVMVA